MYYKCAKKNHSLQEEKHVLKTAIWSVGFCLLIAICSPTVHPQSVGSVINAASCSQSDVQAAIKNVSAASTTVVIPPGICTWTNQLNYAVPSAVTNLTIQGQTTVACTGTPGTYGYNCTATDNTVLIDSYQAPANQLVSITTGGANTSFRITGITFQGGNIGSASNLPSAAVWVFSGGTHNFRIDHCHFNNNTFTPNQGALPTRMYGDIQGVVDHNLFDFPSGGGVEPIGAFNSGTGDSWGDASWAAPTNWGSSAFLFEESNRINGGVLDDCYNGGRIVMRYNTISTGWFGAVAVIHQTGGGAGRSRGCRAAEVYHNYISTTYAGSYGAIAGAAAEVAWGNTLVGFQHVVTSNLIRADSGHATNPPPSNWGMCGSATYPGTGWDGKLNASTGWPCLDQPGRGQNMQALNGQYFPNALNSVTGTIAWPHQHLEPIYIWGNSVSGASSANDWQASLGDIAANRDVYFDCGPANGACAGGFTGANGTGQGTLASRPSTCTAGPGGTNGTSPTGSYGVAYFAADANSGQGELYVCTSTNAWTPVYEPYTYPHPLTQGTSSNPPTAPTGLTVTVQ